MSSDMARLPSCDPESLPLRGMGEYRRFSIPVRGEPQPPARRHRPNARPQASRAATPGSRDLGIAFRADPRGREFTTALSR